ncbi:MAG: MFS transporter [Candidatus Dojkabacteria bacterium]|nr:MAG: MFS transporter [Candidatus Dojkabacteria bacterium]
MKKNLIPIYFLSFVNTIGFSILFPVLPTIIREFSDSEFVYGIVLSTYPLFQFVATPVLGELSDSLGRRPVLIISQFGTLLSWFIFLFAFAVKDLYFYGLSVGLIVIIFSRIVDGITGGNVSVANAYVTDVVPQEDRSRIFANLGLIFGLGFIIGPSLGGLSASFSIGAIGTVVLSIIVSTFTLLCIIFLLPESLINRDDDLNIKKSIMSINIFKKFKEIKEKFIYQIFLIRLFFSLTFAGFTPLLVLFLEDKFNMKPRDLGFVFFILGLFIFVNQGIVSKKISKKFGEYKTFLSGVLITISSIFLFSFINSLILFYILMFLISLGNALFFPNFKTLLANNSDSKKLGLVNGLDESILALSNVISPIISTLIYSIYKFNSFWIYTVCLLMLAALSLWVLEKRYIPNN